MPTRPKRNAFTDTVRNLVSPALVQSAPWPEPTRVRLPALAEAERELEIWEKDLATVVAKQLAFENGNNGKQAPLELLGSRMVLEKRIADAKRKIDLLHAEQAQANYQADAEGWADLQRERALCVLKLRRLNAEAERRFRSYKSGGAVAEPRGYTGLGYGNAAMSWSFRLLGSFKEPGPSGLAAKEFLREMFQKGFISAKELDENG